MIVTDNTIDIIIQVCFQSVGYAV